MGTDADSDERLRTAVGTLLGEPIQELLVLKMGASESNVFRAVSKTQRVVVKTNRHVEFLAQSTHNLEVLAGLGIPVPAVLGFDSSCATFPDAVLVMSEIPGRDLHHKLPTMSHAQMTTLAEQIVSFQKLAASLPMSSGCGYAGIGQTATRTWADVARRPNTFEYADPLPEDTQDLYARVQLSLDRAADYFDKVQPTCFLDDLTTKNVMVDNNGTLTGVVDFDVVAYGDPLLHLGLCGAAVAANTPERCRFYVEELLRLSEVGSEGRGIVGLHQANYLVNFLGAESPNQPGPWRAAAVKGANEGLQAFDASMGLPDGLRL